MSKRRQNFLGNIYRGQKFVIFPDESKFGSVCCVLEKIDHGRAKKVKDGEEVELSDATKILLLDL